MEDLPKSKADRVIGESYLQNGEVIIWDGKYLRCEHGRRRSRCEDCGGSSICEHGRLRKQCKMCDPHGHIKNLISNRIRDAIINHGGLKNKRTLELLGCSVADARIHIESQFSDGMSWENIGEWHIDHRRPCASFDLTLESDQKMCFHYTNLQPMWANENISKHDSFDEDNFEWEWDGSQWIEKA